MTRWGLSNSCQNDTKTELQQSSRQVVLSVLVVLLLLQTSEACLDEKELQANTFASTTFTRLRSGDRPTMVPIGLSDRFGDTGLTGMRPKFRYASDRRLKP